MVRKRPGRLRPHPSVIEAVLANGDVVLVHLETRRSYSLNATGAFVWSLLRHGCPSTDITGAVAGRFDAEPGASEADVHRLLAELLDEELLNAEEC